MIYIGIYLFSTIYMSTNEMLVQPSLVRRGEGECPMD